MILIVCLDDNSGMMFNHRRQSRDSVVIDDIAAECKNSPFYMNEYSFPLFDEKNMENVIVKSDFITIASDGDYCFAENSSLLPYKDKIEKIIVYRWNKKYPSDFYFDINIEKEWKLTESKEFTGTSHDKITKEIYLK